MKATTIAAFSTLIAVIAASFILGGFDKTDDIYPTDDTQIRLYGESHGKKAYYDKELALWKECYDDGCRDLFVELPCKVRTPVVMGTTQPLLHGIDTMSNGIVPFRATF